MEIILTILLLIIFYSLIKEKIMLSNILLLLLHILLLIVNYESIIGVIGVFLSVFYISISIYELWIVYFIIFGLVLLVIGINIIHLLRTRNANLLVNVCLWMNRIISCVFLIIYLSIFDEISFLNNNNFNVVFYKIILPLGIVTIMIWQYIIMKKANNKTIEKI